MKKFFSKIFSVFKKAWFWWLLGLILLCSLVWFALPLLKFGSTVPFASAAIRLAIILVFVIVWAVVNIILARRAKGDDEDVDPEKISRAVELLESNFTKACSIIGKGQWASQLTKRNAYSLPWYITLGAAGSGRSNLLRQSKLPYPVANESYQQIEHDEDELCQFWFSKNAVIIDTKADFFTELKDDSLQQTVWQRLLGLLKGYRRKQPLNGVILTIDLNDLLLKTTQQKAELAHQFRLQLQVLNKRLGIQCPIYICFSKCDRLLGFNEFFESLNEEQRQAALGFTLPQSHVKDSIKQFEAKYTAFVEALMAQSDDAIEALPEHEKVALASAFPQQLLSIKECLNSFLLDVFESNHYQYAHAVRGIFFNSSIQQDTPIDVLEKTTTELFGVENVTKETKKGDKSYFIKGLFDDVLLPEKEVLLFNKIQKKRQTAWRYFSYAVTASIILLFSYFWGNSFMLNNEQLQVVNQSTVDFHSIPGNNKAKGTPILYVLPMLDGLSKMSDAFDNESDSSAMHWGLYQGGKIDTIAEEIYRQNLMIHFMPYVINVAKSELQNPKAQPNQIYNALRVYLMLGNPDKINRDFMYNWLNRYWVRQYKDQKYLINSLSNNLSGLLELDMKPITIDNDLVRQARMKLRGTSQAQRDYFELQELAEVERAGTLFISNGINIDFNLLFGASKARLGVPALYTFTGYNNLYKEQLKTVLENQGANTWVLGEYAEKSLGDESDSPEIALKVRSFYMRDYIKQWTQLTEGLKIVPFDNLQEAGKVLQVASGSTSPIYEVLNAIKDNTMLNPAASKSGNIVAGAQKFMKQNKRLVKAVQPKALKKVTRKAKRFMPKGKKGKGKGSVDDIESPTEKTPVGIHFENLNKLLESSGEKEDSMPIDKIMETLALLNTQIMDINTSSNPNEKAYQLVMQRLGGESTAKAEGETTAGSDGSDPLSLLIQQANATPQPLKGWLLAIANNTWTSLLSSARDYISQQYKVQLLPDYQKTVVDKFPFYSKAKQAVSISQFTEFFGPDGKFEKFFNKYLRIFVNTDSKIWQWKELNGVKFPASEPLLAQFQRADNIRLAFFKSAEEPIKIEYSLRVLSLSARAKSAELRLGNTRLDYRHGPKRESSFTWPDAGSSANLVLTRLNDSTTRFNEKGEWSVFALFKNAKLVKDARSTNLIVRFPKTGTTVEYLLKTDSTLNPFDASLLPEFRLMSTLEK
jgi:type VI secretion system protein ImpL